MKDAPRYYVPERQYLGMKITVGEKYLITYVDDGRQIMDDFGIERIVHPTPNEIHDERSAPRTT